MDTSRELRSPLPWLALWCALLLPLVVLFPPIPVDETRYLTASWNMFVSGQWLVPTINGAWYSDKSPLLFWLIAAGWKVVGVHTWVARLEALVVAVGMLLTLRRLAVRLGVGIRAADDAMWLLAGCLGFALFSTAIMFDLLLALMVLGALHALLDLDAGHWKRGIGLLGLMIGLGTLAKGPVMLLHVAPVALLAPFWSATARGHKPGWYLALAAGLLIGLAILACWLLPAAWYAGPGYWQPLLDKVAGRVANSFAHRRPWWWYLPWLLVLWLPWLLVLRGPRAAWASVARGRMGRFLWCWWPAPFIAFCAISGKQVHYLLPLLPAWALAVGCLLQHPDARVRPLLFGLLALLVGGFIAWLPWLAANRFGYPPNRAGVALALVALVVAIGAWRGWARHARALALGATALWSAALVAAALALLPSLDVAPEAAYVQRVLADGEPLMTVESNNGLFGYVGRLRTPVPWVPRAGVASWCRRHPGGIVLTTDGGVEPVGASPIETWPYLLSSSHRIAAWHARDFLAAPDPATR